MKYVDDYIRVQNLMPIELCKSLIRENSLPEKKWSKHVWFNYDQSTPSKKEEKESDFIYATREQFKMIEKYLLEALQKYQAKYSQEEGQIRTPCIAHISAVRFNRYKVGTQMQAHFDHIHSLFDGKYKGIPILSFIGVLNDNYQGGEVLCRKKEIKLKRGDILLFPSNFMYPHRIKEVTKGIRYSFVGWAF
jgi:predicted 2-oxoglutarate/Fe(II)-dependent dioxygenase YbiX